MDCGWEGFLFIAGFGLEALGAVLGATRSPLVLVLAWIAGRLASFPPVCCLGLLSMLTSRRVTSSSPLADGGIGELGCSELGAARLLGSGFFLDAFPYVVMFFLGAGMKPGSARVAIIRAHALGVSDAQVNARSPTMTTGSAEKWLG